MIPALQRPPEHDFNADDEKRLLSEVRAKDRKATAEFVSQCADVAYPFVCRRLLPRKEAADDLMQEILLAAWQSLPSFRGDSSLRSWILAIARHKVDDYYRKHIREENGEDSSGLDEGRSPDDELSFVSEVEGKLDSATRWEKVHKTLSCLPESYGLALLWRYRDEKSLREMAELTGKTEKAMERLLARARESFRRRWIDG